MDTGAWPIDGAYVQTRTDNQVDSAAGHDLYNFIVALLVGKPPLTRAFGPVEVMGFEPTASTLRT